MIVAAGIQVAQTIGFYIIAAVMVAFAVQVVASRNVVHAALALVMVMAGAAAVYLLLAAEFVAVTQVLVYIGAVMILFLFGVMLTRAKMGHEADLNNRAWALGIPVAVLMAGITGWAVIEGWGDQTLPADRVPMSTQSVSDTLFKPYLLPFWGLSFVLLVAVIGAIVLAKKD